ncbi:hypothetical protein MRX96_058246 [Rhipicephalus microplus]
MGEEPRPDPPESLCFGAPQVVVPYGSSPAIRWAHSYKAGAEPMCTLPRHWPTMATRARNCIRPATVSGGWRAAAGARGGSRAGRVAGPLIDPAPWLNRGLVPGANPR